MIKPEMHSQPPSYEYAVSDGSHQPLMSQGPFSYTGETKAGTLSKGVDTKGSPPSSPRLQPSATYYSTPGAGPSSPGEVTVYNYQNPRNGHVITSLLPPDHPEMICLQEGQHITQSRFGLVGVLAAIFWFPLGIACCLLDRRVTCRRCGLVINHSFMDC